MSVLLVKIQRKVIVHIQFIHPHPALHPLQAQVQIIYCLLGIRWNTEIKLGFIIIPMIPQPILPNDQQFHVDIKQKKWEINGIL